MSSLPLLPLPATVPSSLVPVVASALVTDVVAVVEPLLVPVPSVEPAPSAAGELPPHAASSEASATTRSRSRSIMP
ncbi:MAG: hypothetical protein U0168_04140 [Nannocystaceae bacterium]